MILPNWRLHQLNSQGKGERLGKLPKLPVPVAPRDETWPCGMCKRPVYNQLIGGSASLNGVYRDSKRWHYQCAPYPRFFDSPTGIVRIVGPDGPAVSTQNLAEEWKKIREDRLMKPEMGNLPEAEYRYWFGSRSRDVTFSKCRACNTIVYGTNDRVAHFRDDKFKVGGNACTTQLTLAYKAMLRTNEDICIICKGKRFKHCKWGVPICQLANCINEWKFGLGKMMPIELELRKQKMAQRRVIVDSDETVQVYNDQLDKIQRNFLA